MKALPSAYISFVLFLLLLSFGFADAPVFSDPDTAWHIAAGDLIRGSGRLPLHDSWSFTATDDIWYNLSWLYDYLLSFLFAYGGISAVYTLTIAAFALSVALMAAHCVRRGASPILVFLLLAPLAMAMFGGVMARPNMCSIALTCVFYLMLHGYGENRKFCRLSILAPLMCFWVNLHGGFLFAFLLIGCFIVQTVAEHDRKAFRAYSFLFALCLLATLINPYGIGVYYGALKTLNAEFSHVLMEWKPAEIGHNLPITCLLVIFMLVSDLSDRKVPLADRATGTLVMLMALSSLRHAPLAALLLLPYLGLRATSLAYAPPIGARLTRLDGKLKEDMGKKDVKWLGLIMLFAAFAAIYTTSIRDAVLKEPAGFSAGRFPSEEAAFVETHYPHLRFLNDYNLGGYLDYLWRGQVKVFVDGRANSLYSDQLLKDYEDFYENHGYGGKAQRVIDQYRIEGLIIANNGTNAGLWLWNPDWRVVFKGRAATVFIYKDTGQGASTHSR